eukprot:1223519-Rhodomonas_salina.1
MRSAASHVTWSRGVDVLKLADSNSRISDLRPEESWMPRLRVASGTVLSVSGTAESESGTAESETGTAESRSGPAQSKSGTTCSQCGQCLVPRSQYRPSKRTSRQARPGQPSL